MQFRHYNRLAKRQRQDLDPARTPRVLLAKACRAHDRIMAGLSVNLMETAFMQAVDRALSKGNLVLSGRA